MIEEMNIFEMAGIPKEHSDKIIDITDDMALAGILTSNTIQSFINIWRLHRDKNIKASR